MLKLTTAIYFSKSYISRTLPPPEATMSFLTSYPIIHARCHPRGNGHNKQVQMIVHGNCGEKPCAQPYVTKTDNYDKM
eukprot:4258499-Ditylum_brightwellii.AAC.1